jgi:N-acetylmuramoyl-L-alanine amidase
MKINKLKKVIVSLVCVFALNTSINIYGSTQEINLMVNETVLTNLSSNPVILNGTTLVPARYVFEEVGATVSWVDHTREVIIIFEEDVIILTIDNDYANVNGNMVKMEVPAQIINGSTLIPVRFTAEALGFEVDWLEPANLVIINTTARQENEAPQNEAPPKQEQDNNNLAKDVSTQAIQTQQNPTTNIVSFNAQNNNFIITSSSPITKVQKNLLEDNRLVIDIYNSNLQIVTREYESLNPNINSIRLGSGNSQGVSTTRVVFDLVGSIEYYIRLSEDRTKLIISFEENELLSVVKNSDTSMTLMLKNKGQISTSYLNSPNMLAIDIHNTVATQEVLNKQIEGVTITQVNQNTVRILMPNVYNFQSRVTSMGAYTNITLFDHNIRNFYHEPQNRRFKISKNEEMPFSIGDIQRIENIDANNMEVILILPVNISSYLGEGKFITNTVDFEYIEIRTNASNNTEISFKSNQVLTYVITESSANVYVNYRLPREVYSRIVVLDAGHGGTDPGAVGLITTENYIVMDITNRVEYRLNKNDDIKVYVTRNTDTRVPLPERVRFGNEVGDIFISIHANSAFPNTTVSGIETFYYPHENDYIRGFSSRDMAEIFQTNKIADLGAIDRGVKRERFYVIRHTEIPSVLLEVGFISNPAEEYLMSTPEYRDKIAESIYRSILEVFEIYTPVR